MSRLPFSIRAAVRTFASLAVLVCAGAGASSPAVAQGNAGSGDMQSALGLVNQMTAAIKACDYDAWAKAKSTYDYFVPRSRIEDQRVPAAPSYPFPCNEVSQKKPVEEEVVVQGSGNAGSGNIRSALRLVNQMIAAIKACDYDAWAKAKSTYDYFVSRSRIEDQRVPAAPPYPFPCHEVSQKKPVEPPKLYSVGTLVSPPKPVDWSGFYIGGNFSVNRSLLGQTERFRMTDAVTTQVSDSSNAVGGGFSTGYLFPLGNNILIGPAVSVDFLNQNTNHDFAGGFFFGQTINTITTVSGQVAFAPLPNLLFYGEAGAAFANVTQKLNFSGPVTTADQTVTGLNLGIGAAFQPANWQIAGIPVVVFGQYNHVILPDAQFINPGSPAFIYNNQTNIDKVEAGVRIEFPRDLFIVREPFRKHLLN